MIYHVPAFITINLLLYNDYEVRFLRELLDGSAQRIIRILETLLEEDGSMTLDRLALTLNASQRTLADDLNLLQDRWGNLLHLEVTRKNGISLHNHNISAIGVVCRDLFNESVGLRWLRELLFHPRQTMETYEKRLFVSNSTLRRLLPRIQNVLSQKGMTIAQENGKYWFEGTNEQNLRDFAASFLLELNGLDLSNFDVSMDLDVLESIIRSLQERNTDPQHHETLAQDDVVLAYQMMFYLISLVRERTGFNVPSTYPAVNELTSQQLNCLAKFFPDVRPAQLAPIHEHLRSFFHAFPDPKEQAYVQDVIETFLSGLLRDLRLTPPPPIRTRLSFIMHSILCNLKMRPYKTSELFDRIWYFSENIQRQNPFLYDTTHHHLELAACRLNLDLPLRIADVLFWICLTYPDITAAAPPLRILLLNDLGNKHARFLETLVRFQLKNRSSEIIIDANPSKLHLNPDDCMSYDLVLSTCPEPPPHPRCLILSDYPLDSEWHALHSLLREVPERQAFHPESPLA